MEPLTSLFLGGASSLASMYFNDRANNAVNDARAGVINAERARQAQLDAEAKGVTDKSLGRYANFDTGMDADASRLAAFYKAPVLTPNTPYTVADLPPTSSPLVDREIANKSGIASAFVNNQADKLAKFRAFGDYLGGIGRGVARDTQTVNQIGGFKKGSQGVEQFELDNANRAGNGYKLLGDLLGGAGKVGLTAALSGVYDPPPVLNPDGSIEGAFGPTSVGGRPLVGLSASQASPKVFTSGAAPFLTYGR